MNNLHADVTKLIETYLTKFFSTLEPSISQKVQSAWTNFLLVPTESVNQVELGKCSYVFKKGKKLGDVCQTTLRDGGGAFCTKHKTIPQVSTKIFQLDLSRIEDESEIEEEIYLSPSKEVMDDEGEVDMENSEDEVDEDNNDDDGDGSAVESDSAEF